MATDERRKHEGGPRGGTKMLELTAEQKEILAVVREFAEREIKPVVKEYEPYDRYPQPIVDRMKELGLFGLTIPEEYGGAGLDFVTYALVFEELRSEEHTSELQSRENLVCRRLLEKKKTGDSEYSG